MQSLLPSQCTPSRSQRPLLLELALDRVPSNRVRTSATATKKDQAIAVPGSGSTRGNGTKFALRARAISTSPPHRLVEASAHLVAPTLDVRGALQYLLAAGVVALVRYRRPPARAQADRRGSGTLRRTRQRVCDLGLREPRSEASDCHGIRLAVHKARPQ
ncbi:hypothetical protein BV20DRAFT_972467 [Pilatotrama ljubarskyi]|nr:hypothetical protein BV20DRAFT_972467 [Pilatotrama ljubarskyi]